MPALDIPPDARQHLDEVVRYHRDRDEFPIGFRQRYLLPRQSGPMQSAYDAAIAVLSAAIDGACPASREDLIQTVGRFNSDGFLPPDVSSKLDNLFDSGSAAHAWAASYIYATFFDIEPYLQTGLSVGSRLLATYPELTDLITPRDLLLRVGQAVVPGHSWVSYKNHEIHPHPGLRRQYHARVHYDLLARLWDQLSAGNAVSIGIDHYRLCPRGELGRVIELDAWFGARFSLKSVDDGREVGSTVHGRVRHMSPTERAGLLTEFRWGHADGLKTLEVEELPSPTAGDHNSNRPVICRYVHSIRDTSTKRFIHLDGAMTIYEPDAYLCRYEQATNHIQRKVWSTRKVKLFRIDTPIQNEHSKIREDAWIELIVSFFRGNELVLEYFDGRPFAETYRSRYGRDLRYWDEQ